MTGTGPPVSVSGSGDAALWFAAIEAKYGAQNIWGPIVQSSECPACRLRAVHIHGFYAPSGGGE